MISRSRSHHDCHLDGKVEALPRIQQNYDDADNADDADHDHDDSDDDHDQGAGGSVTPDTARGLEGPLPREGGGGDCHRHHHHYHHPHHRHHH